MDFAMRLTNPFIQEFYHPNKDTAMVFNNASNEQTLYIYRIKRIIFFSLAMLLREANVL